MTQQQIPHPAPLPACRAGHPARHMLDRRRAEAGGGHFIECRCRSSGRHPDYEAALADWQRRNGRRAPRRPAAAPVNVVQLDLLRNAPAARSR